MRLLVGLGALADVERFEMPAGGPVPVRMKRRPGAKAEAAAVAVPPFHVFEYIWQFEWVAAVERGRAIAEGTATAPFRAGDLVHAGR
jgi:hypothetical protein